VGISADFLPASAAWSEKMGLTFPLLSDVSRKTLEAYDFLETDPANRLYRYARRSYVIIDKAGIVRYKKVLEKPGDLVADDELLKELDRLNEPEKPK
jgi:glutaredoxin-dependent peroxiredoxin